MTDTRKALEMAIEALEGIDECYWEHTVLQACKEALAEAEKHEWQSLSDDEIDEIWVKSFGSSEIVHNLDFARAIKQALKEKNHG